LLVTYDFLITVRQIWNERAYNIAYVEVLLFC